MVKVICVALILFTLQAYKAYS